MSLCVVASPRNRAKDAHADHSMTGGNPLNICAPFVQHVLNRHTLHLTE